MDFKEFKAKLVVLDDMKGGELRDKYIEKFVNTNHELYKEQIQSKQEFLDGYCYLGYLWDYIKAPVIIEKSYLEIIAKGMGNVYVFWDIHSCERIFIENYWKFNKDAVLKLDFETLLNGEEYLPDDIYIFDECMSWTLIKTHEDIDGKCYCLKSGEI
jgi:hypothetical protein